MDKNEDLISEIIMDGIKFSFYILSMLIKIHFTFFFHI